jgi:hypothetical protein
MEMHGLLTVQKARADERSAYTALVLIGVERRVGDNLGAGLQIAGLFASIEARRRARQLRRS